MWVEYNLRVLGKPLELGACAYIHIICYEGVSMRMLSLHLKLEHEVHRLNRKEDGCKVERSRAVWNPYTGAGAPLG